MSGWTVTTLHGDGCAECQAAADVALTHAKMTGSVGATWSNQPSRRRGDTRGEGFARGRAVRRMFPRGWARARMPNRTERDASL